MTETFGSESFSKNTDLAADLSGAQAWVSDAVNSAYLQFKNNPVECAAGALLVAGAGVAALRFRNPAIEEVGQIGLRRLGAAAKGESAAVGSAEAGASSVLPAIESSTIKSPFVLRKPSWVNQSDGGIPEYSTIEKPKLSFSGMSFDPVSNGRVSIPSFSLEHSADKAMRVPIPKILNELTDSPIARLYANAAGSTVKVLHNGKHGSGFFVDEAGYIATAGHVVPDASHKVRVMMANGEFLPARLVARDQTADLALLKVDKLYDRPAPLALMEFVQDAAKGRNIFQLGHPSGVKEVVLSEGTIQKVSDRLIGNKTLATLSHDVPSFFGSSGSPLLLDNGLVAAVHARGSLTTGRGTGMSALHVRDMLDVISSPGYKGRLDVATDASRQYSYLLYGALG